LAVKIKKIETQRGFTLIELMIVVAIIGILAGIAIPQFANLVSKAQEGATKGNLSTLRSAIAIYYGDTQGVYPFDVTAITNSQKYLQVVPSAQTPKSVNSIGHAASGALKQTNFAAYVTDAGGWSYDNANSDTTWGSLVVNCSHKDIKGNIWTSY
jgi:prepilin-type N-terminal cleavage/methylation domain-containing protein